MQGFNRYYPPDYDPRDPRYRGNLNRLAGKSAQKPVVRFEMPFGVWCLQCDSHIAQGVRFNAHKEKTGNYLSSPIYTFSMTCHLCSGSIVIATNPKDTCYDVVSGAKKKAEEWNAQDNGTFEYSRDAPDDEDPLHKLEKDTTQQANVRDAKTHISQLLEQSDRQWRDTYTQSQKVRRNFRQQKKMIAAREEEKIRLQARHALGLDILDRTESDVLSARNIDFERSSASTNTHEALLDTIRTNTQLKYDAFQTPIDGSTRQQSMRRQPETSKKVSSLDDSTKQTRLVEYDSSGDSAS